MGYQNGRDENSNDAVVSDFINPATDRFSRFLGTTNASVSVREPAIEEIHSFNLTVITADAYIDFDRDATRSSILVRAGDTITGKKITKSDGEIKWNLSSKEIYLKTLAYNPWPKTYSWWNGKRIILTKMQLTSTKENNNVAPGTIIRTSSNKIAVSTATTDLLLSTIQLEGKREISVQEFVLGHPTFINSKLK